MWILVTVCLLSQQCCDKMRWLKCGGASSGLWGVLHWQLPPKEDKPPVKGLQAVVFCCCFIMSIRSVSETRNVSLLWLGAKPLFMEICVLMLLMFSFHSLVKAIKEIVFLADWYKPCRMRTSGNLNFCHWAAKRRAATRAAGCSMN